MCGGTIEFEQGATVGVCDSCGTKQTLPRLDDDRRANLYDRANHFRRNNEFDKAAGLYEQILNEDSTDAEAYWSLVLCRYGIEYVEDPATCKRVPTVNRAQFTSIFDDDNYKSAIQYADSYQRAIYEAEANAINEIQKGILAISQKEEPFDVFICYKETDANGRRTQDSVLANDLYHQLTNEGFKVFFSRVTLEDKLGTAYEPYIFAALNSAKVMVVLGTKPEHFNSVWVKNEWSRYLALVKESGGRKTLIPAYRDMDPYDLPEEFSHLQAQDMSKLGFMQDLIRGIKKIAKADEPKAAVKETVVIGGNANVDPLLKRAFMFLEDGEWNKADDFCEQVLNQDPENARAYLGKLMAEMQIRCQEDLADCEQPFNDRSNFQKAVRFGDEKTVSVLNGYIAHINERNENNRLTGIYNRAAAAMNAADSKESFKSAAEIFKTIPGFKDADDLAKQCLYNSAVAAMNTANSEASFKSAAETFKTIPGFKDADDLAKQCLDKAEEKRIVTEKEAKERKKIVAIIMSVAVICAAFGIVWTMVIIPKQKYDRAVAMIGSGDYESAYILLNGLNYRDSSSKLNSIKPQYKRILLSKVQVGSHVFFGSYEQDNNTSNGKEDIEWLVLAKDGNKALIISKYALDCKQYNPSSFSDVTWETSTLRKWLNGTFLDTAFSTEEQNRIVSSTVTADKNSSYSTSPGNNTTDKVFLLSIAEVNRYFTSDKARQCQGTAYCFARGAYKEGRNGLCWWWLRSPGGSSSFAAGVKNDGFVSNAGSPVYLDNMYTVRPALWINLGR